MPPISMIRVNWMMPYSRRTIHKSQVHSLFHFVPLAEVESWNDPCMSVFPSVPRCISKTAHRIIFKFCMMLKGHLGVVHMFLEFWKNPRWPPYGSKFVPKSTFFAISLKLLTQSFSYLVWMYKVIYWVPKLL